MNLLQRLLGQADDTRSISTVEDYLSAVNTFGFNGNYYPLGATSDPFVTTMGHQAAERIQGDFVGMASQMFGSSSVIFACMAARLSVFSAARFQYQALRAGRPSELFGDPSLGVLERPWEGGTTQDLLARMIVDADLAGNSYWTLYEGELIRLRPDWVDIVCEPRVVGPPRPTGGPDRGPQVMGWRKLGFLYHEGGRGESEPVPLLYSDVAHFAPTPDPLASYRGMSWLTPVIKEVTADDLMIRHKRRFLEHAATPNLVVKHDPAVTKEQLEQFAAFLDERHAGADNAYRTMHLGGGADPVVVGANFAQLEFSATQGHGETRIAAAAGVPPIIVGLSEGLQAATYSNYAQARRRFADGTMHPLWGNAAGSLEQIRKAPGGARLWFDTRDVPFLREDSKDAAEIAETQARTVRTLVDGGYTPESVSRFMAAGAADWTLLDHSGLVSVQLLPPGAEKNPAKPTEPAKPTPNGAKPTPAKPAPKPAPKPTPAKRSESLPVIPAPVIPS